MTEDLDQLTAAISQSAKYRYVCEDLIRRIGLHELNRRCNLKAAIKETKNTLHQIAGAYLESTPPYAKWRETISGTERGSEQWGNMLRGMMLHHSSTRERLPYLEAFYKTILADVQPVRSVLDLACGLNPLAMRWMPLAAGCTYYAYDVYTDMMAFLNEFAAGTYPGACADACDISVSVPQHSVHVAYVLKFLPLLKGQSAGETLLWLRKIRAEYLVVSFPTRTLGGRNVHMSANYEAWFRDVIHEMNWELQTFSFPTELCFLIETGFRCA